VSQLFKCSAECRSAECRYAGCHGAVVYDRPIKMIVIKSEIDRHLKISLFKQVKNRLDKVMIKYNEAMSIKKTYELIVKRLKEERIGYDNQLAAIEHSLKGKDQDLEELISLSHDAAFAKEQAESDLKKYE
jgi:hypothetical protein